LSGKQCEILVQERIDREVAEHELIDRLFYFWDFSHRGALSFQVMLAHVRPRLLILMLRCQDIVHGLDTIIFSDLMEAIEWFFSLHDKDKDGFLTKDEVLQLSESLLVCLPTTSNISSLTSISFLEFIFRYEIGDAYLGAVSGFMTNAFEYGDEMLQKSTSPADTNPTERLPHLHVGTISLISISPRAFCLGI